MSSKIHKILISDIFGALIGILCLRIVSRSTLVRFHLFVAVSKMLHAKAHPIDVPMVNDINLRQRVLLIHRKSWRTALAANGSAQSSGIYHEDVPKISWYNLSWYQRYLVSQKSIQFI